jgi:ubiquinone/menaquinone biosynthesis C-methylase UbiE
MVSDRPAVSVEAIDAATRHALAHGVRMLTTHRYGTNDDEHVRAVLQWLDPADGATILDAGCGVGEASRLMSAMRPDLAFVLANVSAFQLSECPTGERFAPLVGDCHELSLADNSVDAVMFLSALCQMNAGVALREARRVTRAGGPLLVVDIARVQPGAEDIEAAIGTRFPGPEELKDLASAAGWRVDWLESPKADDRHFAEMLEGFGGAALIPCIGGVVLRGVAI